MATGSKPPSIVKIVNSLAYVNIIIYGDPGIGKTPLAGTSPNALFLEADDGESSAAVWGTTAEMWKVRDWGDVTEAAEWLKHEGHKVYEWVWLDSGTIFQDSGLADIMEDLVAAKPHRNKYVPDKGEYGENMNRFKELIRELKALPMNFGMTCHVSRVEDRDGATQYMPAIQGKEMPQKICALMDVVGFLDFMRNNNPEHEGRRALRLENLPGYYTKDRFHCTEKGVLLDPTIPKLMSLINKKRAAAPVKAAGAAKVAAVPTKAVAKKAAAPVKSAAKKAPAAKKG